MKNFEEGDKKIDRQIKENNAHVTAMYRENRKAGKEAALAADAKLINLFAELGINPAEYARRKLALK